MDDGSDSDNSLEDEDPDFLDLGITGAAAVRGRFGSKGGVQGGGGHADSRKNSSPMSMMVTRRSVQSASWALGRRIVINISVGPVRGRG